MDKSLTSMYNFLCSCIPPFWHESGQNNIWAIFPSECSPSSSVPTLQTLLCSKNRCKAEKSRCLLSSFNTSVQLRYRWTVWGLLWDKCCTTEEKNRINSVCNSIRWSLPTEQCGHVHMLTRWKTFIQRLQHTPRRAWAPGLWWTPCPCQPPAGSVPPPATSPPVCSALGPTFRIATRPPGLTPRCDWPAGSTSRPRLCSHHRVTTRSPSQPRTRGGHFGSATLGGREVPCFKLP